MDIGDALGLDAPPHGLVIGAYGHQLHGEMADFVPVQQIVEAMPELRHEDEHPRLHREVMYLPVEVETERDRRESLPEAVRGHCSGPPKTRPA